MANEFFISYSRKDKKFVHEIFVRLKQAGIDPWIDFEDLRAATYWRQEIAVGIQYCHNFIFCISPNSVASVECIRELEHALAMDKRIIPVIVQATPVHLIHEGLKEINWISFEDFEEGFKQLLSVLDSPLGFTFGGRLDSKIEVNYAGTIRNFYLYRNRYLIGRYPQVDGEVNFNAGLIVVGDPYVSRVSATLQFINNRWYLGDGLVTFNKEFTPVEFVRSRNGNQVNGKRQNSRQLYPLIHGDVIRIGPSTTLVYLELRPESEAEEGDNKETLV